MRFGNVPLAYGEVPSHQAGSIFQKWITEKPLIQNAHVLLK
jgi:hypothetical protein